MATTDLSAYDPESVPSSGDMKFGIVVSDWNKEITWALLEGAIITLKKHGTSEENILVRHVPGSFELTLGAQLIAEYEDTDGVICLGCLIKGETPHFEYICQGVTNGITELNIKYNIPFVFGVLTTLTIEQARERAGGVHGNKGDEAAVTAIKMAALRRSMKK
ncbi:MAG: 6,7-dimethyl-8-ribityllumazine synthase [Bacteroidales bacterium]|jgi:6,7-dimethyl-8-ribityllumazine synthase|nr:6,7-dimethyl-8-ribityllumazine synthase [Bacteroidales bacterium]